jgi:hypothetical protein
LNLFRFIPGYESVIYESGREPALVMLLAFLITFVITRAYTRIAAALQFAFHPDEGPVQLLLTAVFGSGAALVLDDAQPGESLVLAASIPFAPVASRKTRT